MNTRFKASVIALSLQIAFAGGTAFANPVLDKVVSGQVGITNPNASTLLITSSPGAYIKWQDFSIAKGEITRFIQESAASTVVNRVVGQNLSQIYGSLLSNGKVFLINPAGILVGSGAVIDTAGFIASSLDLKQIDGSKLRFEGDASAGAITIEKDAWIRTGYGGHVALIAPKIENSGVISTPGGGILLAAGQKVTIVSLDHGDVQFEVQAPTDSVVNLGRLLADGGAVRAFAGSLKHSGEIRANALVRDAAGEIVLAAQKDVELAAGSVTAANGRSGGSISVESASGTVHVSGTVSATGSAGAGGRIEVTGERVWLLDNAVIDASGSTGGGTILAGGDWQGVNPDIRNADDTFVGSGVALKADATDRGDGGKIVVWADGTTRFFGNLSARGGPNGGDGGQAEVSGKGDLLFIGGASLGAPKGKLGTLLLDPLDLFVDDLGGLNPYIVNENDPNAAFPSNAVTVSPQTLQDRIDGNVTLYASRDLRINSAIDLRTRSAEPLQPLNPLLPPVVANAPTPGKGLTATAGRNLQIGAGITTDGGAVSLTAGANLAAFLASPITTNGGTVNLLAPTISAGLMTIAAGGGAVTAVTTAGSLNLGPVTSSGSIALTSTGGSLNTASLNSTGTVSLTSNSGSINVNDTLTAGSNVTLTSSGSIDAQDINTNGGSLVATANGGYFTDNGTIDTRPGQSGISGGNVSITAQGSVNTWEVYAGSGNVTMSGTSVYNNYDTIDTTGNVSLTATNGSIYAKIDNAASVTASAAYDDPYGADNFIHINSDTTLNATSITSKVTGSGCASSYSCSTEIRLEAQNGVNVGTVRAEAPVQTTTGSYGNLYHDKNESVEIQGGDGPILAMSANSQITAANVKLETNQGSGAGIGSAATPLNVAVERYFGFLPNGTFKVQLNGAGPNQLDMAIGVAKTGEVFTGTLTKSGINVDVSANDTTVTLNTLSITSGFDAKVYEDNPYINFRVPNGGLVATSVALPQGDVTGVQRKCNYSNCTYTEYASLNASIGARDDLTLASYNRAKSAQSRAQQTSIRSDSGKVTLGTIDGNLDSIEIYANTGVDIQDSVTTGNSVDISTNSGNVLVNHIDTNSGSGTVTIYAPGFVGAPASSDSSALDIEAGTGSVYITAGTIGNNANANPLDIAAGYVSLTSQGGGIGFSGKPVTARTQNLAIDAATTFNVDTKEFDLTDLSVTARPGGVGNGGLATVMSNGTSYAFASDGSNFTLTNWTAPAAQFNGGTLSFTTASGNLTLNNIDFSSSNGSLSLTTHQAGNGSVTQLAATSLNLGSGFLSIQADGPVSLRNFTSGGLGASNYSSAACLSSGSFCGVNGFTTNGGTITDPTHFGSFSVTSRNGIATGTLDVGNVSFRAHTGNVTTGAIGKIGASPAANSVSITTDTGWNPGSVSKDITVAGGIEANSVDLRARSSAGATIQVNGDINGSNSSSSNVFLGSNGTVNVTGNINAGVSNPGSVTLQANSSVTAGTLDGIDIGVSRYDCCTSFVSGAVTLGAIGSHSAASSVSIYGGTVNILGPVTLDGTSTGQLSLNATGTLSIGGAVTAGNTRTMTLSSGGTMSISGGQVVGGDGSTINITAGGASPFAFSRIRAGATGTVTVNAGPGLDQTEAPGTGGGIEAKTVTLRANAANSTMAGSYVAGAGQPKLAIRGATILTLESAGAMNLDLAAIGGGLAPTLTNLSITRSNNTKAFSLTGQPVGQSLTVTNVAGGVDVGLTSTTPLAFAYTNSDSSNSALTGTGITLAGGSLTLTANGAGGNITTGAIASGGAPIVLNAAAGINVSGAVDGGVGIVTLGAGQSGAGSVAGSGSLTSTTSVNVTANAGNIGASGTPLAINSSVVNMTATRSTGGGDVFAGLTGTTNLTMRADNGFTVTDSVDLARLDLTTRGDTTGATALTTPTQTFDFGRNAGTQTLVIDNNANGVGIASATPLAYVRVRSTNGAQVGSLLARGSIAADELRLEAGGDVKLDGTASPLTLSNVTQNFIAGQDLRLEGNLTLTATSSQTLSASRDIVSQPGLVPSGAIAITSGGSQNFSADNDILLQANGGPITVSAAGTQNIFARGAIKFYGGSNIGDSVTVSAGGDQLINSPSEFGGGLGRDIELKGGTAGNTSVLLTHGGSGDQTIQSNRDILLTGGAVGTTGVKAEIVASSGNQTVKAVRNVVLGGGDGSDAQANIRNTGPGTQEVGESDRGCCYFDLPYQTDAVTLQGGAGTGASVSLLANGLQTVMTRFGTISVLGGSGGNATALVQNASTQEQRIGYPAFDFCCGNRSSNLNIGAGSGLNASAGIVASGFQRVDGTGNLTMAGNANTGTAATLQGAGQRLRFSGNVSLNAGAGQDASVLITSTGASGSQDLQWGPTNINSGANSAAGTNARVVIAAATSQSGSMSGLNINTGAGAAGGGNATVALTAGTSQSLSSGTTDIRGGAGTGSSVTVTSGTTQSWSGGGNLSLAGGSGSGSRVRVEAGTTQSVNKSGAISLTGGAGAGADVLLQGDSQNLAASGNFNVTGGSGVAGQESGALVNNRSGTQTINASGAVNVVSNANYGNAGIVNAGSGQTINATGGVRVEVTGGSGQAVISNASGSQTLNNNSSTSTGMRVQVTGGSGGTASIANNGGNQTVRMAFVDVNTSGAATGSTASLTASGDQSIHTLNGTASGGNGSLRIAGLAAGSTAKIQSGGKQLLEVDYPELMNLADQRDGRLSVGSAGAQGASLLKAVDQDVFARSITVQGGSVAGADAKIDVSGTQNISILTPRTQATAIAAGINVKAGAGGKAAIDPVTQNIVANGLINVLGGSGPNTTAGILATGDQNILVTAPADQNSVAVGGGDGLNSFGQITTSGLVQRLGTTGGITLTPGAANQNADAFVGAGSGSGTSFFSCGVGFVCNLPDLASNPTVNPSSDFGAFRNPVQVPLDQLLATVGNELAPPIDPFSTILTMYGNALVLAEGTVPDEEDDRRFRKRGLDVCR